jgi:hypothetical protein
LGSLPARVVRQTVMNAVAKVNDLNALLVMEKMVFIKVGFLY